MPCESTENPAPARRETVDVTTDGTQTTVRFGDAYPSQTGWVISIGLESKVAGTAPEFTLTMSDQWLGSAELNVGDQNGSIMACQGGRFLCPFPTVSFDFFDGVAAGGGTQPRVQLIARPLSNNQASGASTQLRGVSQAAINASANNDFSAPLGAIAYWVARPSDGGDVDITVEDGAGSAVEVYSLSDASAAYPLQAPAPWRDVPIWNNGSTAPVINVAPGAGTGSGTIYKIHWLFDLATLR